MDGPLFPDLIRRKIADCPRAQEVPYKERDNADICELDGWCKACSRRIKQDRWEAFINALERVDVWEFGFLRLSFPLSAAKEGDLRKAVEPGKWAATRTIAQVFGIGSKTGSRTIVDNTRSMVGAVVRYDPWGMTRPGWLELENRPDWPTWAPSIEMIFPLVQFDGEDLRRLRPKASSLKALQETGETPGIVAQSYERFYKERVKENGGALDGAPDWEEDYRELGADPRPRVQTPPSGRARNTWIRHHLEGFSRPLFEAWRAQETDAGEISYPLRGWGREPDEVTVTHPDPFAEIRRIEDWLNGHKKRDYYGILAGASGFG